VDPGLGVYMWIDYNHDGIKTIGEFEVAPTPSQGEYIKVFTPSNSYIKTYNNQFSEVLTLKPAAVWETKTGFKKFVSRFSNQTSYRVDRKSTNDNLEIAYNPFLGLINDSLLSDSTIKTLNSSFRNTLTINQQSSVFGIDLSYQDNQNKVLNVNGIDSRKNIYEEVRVRWNIVQQLSWNFDGILGVKKSNSGSFESRNFDIDYYSLEPKFNYQPNTSFRISVAFKYTDKSNPVNDTIVRATMQDYGTEIKWNVLNKGSFNLKANFIQIKFGKGKLFVSSLPEVFSNYHFVSERNSDYVYKALSYLPNQQIIWDEYYKVGNVHQDSPMRVIFNNPALLTAYYLLMLSLIIYMIIGAKRKQRVIPVIEPLRNTTLDFVDIVGTLYYQAGNHKNLADKKITFFLEYIRTSFQVKTTLYDDTFIERISNLSGIDKQKVHDLFYYFSDITFKQSITQQQLLKLNRMIEDFYNENKR